MHDDCSLFHLFSKYCDVNCDELVSYGVGCKVKYCPVVRCDPDVPPEVVFIQPSKDTWQVNLLFDARGVHFS